MVSFETALSPRGLGVMVALPGDDESAVRRAIRLVNAKMCGSIVVQADQLSEEEMRAMSALSVPVVLCNFGEAKKAKKHGLHSVGFDNERGIRQAVNHLASLGHHRVGFLGGTPGWIDSQERLSAFRAAMGECGLPVDERWVRACDFEDGFRSGAQGLDFILSQTIVGPTAVICANDEIAAGGYAAAKGWGKNVPQDISIVGFGDSRWSEYVEPRLTSIRHDSWDLGKSLGSVFAEVSNAKEPKLQNVLIETRLMVRDSTGPAPEVA